jgi:transcriptional regulator with XRE-family HTH domain
MELFRIREIRKAKGLTIAQLADAAGISSALVSQVERDLADPSLETIRKIARALDVPVFNLFCVPEQTNPVAVIRAGQETKITSSNGHVSYIRKSQPGTDLEVLVGTIQPGDASSPVPLSHPSEECIIATEGVVTVEVNGATYDLAVGDSCHYNSRLPHRLINNTADTIQYIVAVTPPSY